MERNYVMTRKVLTRLEHLGVNIYTCGVPFIVGDKVTSKHVSNGHRVKVWHRECYKKLWDVRGNE